MPTSELTCSAVEPRPRRRCWGLPGLLALVGLVAWLLGRESETVLKARQLKLGMTIEETDAIMGEPATRSMGLWTIPTYDGLPLNAGVESAAYATTGERMHRRICAELDSALHGIPVSAFAGDWPVQVWFDRAGRVERISRGTEIIESPASQEK